MSLLPSPIPHPLDYSPWDLPGWVYEALDWVIGVEWPEGDERAVWDLADQWYDVAAALAGPRDDAIAAAAEVRSGYGGIGLVAEAFDTAWRRVADGDEAPLLVLLAVSDELGRLVEECGCDIEGAKLEVWIELGILVVELLAIAVASVVTAGAASPAVGAATTASRLVVQQIFKRLLAQLAKKELKQGLKEAGERAAKEVARGGMRGLGKRAARGGLEEATEESGISLATQAYQNSTGRRDGLDLADLGASAVGGFAGGAVAPLAGLGRHAHGRGARIVEHFGREMTGETLAEGAAGLATGQGVMSLEDAARAAVSGATGSATGQVDAAVRARIDGQLSALAAPLPPMELPLVPPVAAGDLPSPRDGSSSEAGASALSGGSRTGAAPAASLADAAPPAPQPDREPVAVGKGEAVPAVEVGSASDRGASAAVTVDAAASTQAGHGPSSGSPTLSSVTAERPPSPQVGEVPATAAHSTTMPTAANPATSAPVTTGPVTTSAAIASPATVTTSGTLTSATVTSSGTMTSPGTGVVGSAATSVPPANANGSASAHPPVAAAHGSPPAVTPPSVQRPTPVGAETPPRQGPGTPEQDGDVATRNRFPSLEALAPATSPLPEAQPSPVPPGPATELPRLRTPEWYAAKWAAEREALERRRYQGYFESQRAWYEDKRRFDAASRRKDVARTHEERARRSARRAIELQREGRVEMADWFQRLANQDQRDAFDEQDLADDILAGRVVPDEVFIDNPADFQRINDDVADLALGAVETSDRSALTGADDDPPPIDRSRRYGQWGGLRPPLALHQTDLERQMPRHPDGSVVRTADPRQGGWFALANDGGPQADPTRGINCLDCTLSLFETWVHGRPRVSAPRTFDGYAAGDIRCPIMGEKNGPRRVEQVTGGRFQKLVGRREEATDSRDLRDAVDRGFENLRVQLKIGGHGSYAFLITEWENGGSHAWVALNQNGTILYLDPQSGAVYDQPLYRHRGVDDPDNVISVDALVLGGDGRPMPLGGLARGRFSVLPDLPDYPSTPEDEAGYGDPYLNRLHLLDGPGMASPGGGAAADGGGPARSGLPQEADEPPGEQQNLRRERDQALAARLSAGTSVQQVVAESVDLDAVFAAGVTPAEAATQLDPATLGRLAPHLDERDARDVAKLLADPQVRRMLADTWEEPPLGEPMLAERLMRQLARRPDLTRIVLATPEVTNSLTARPVTLYHLLGYQQAIDTLGSVLEDIAERGYAAVSAGGPTTATPTVLTDEQRQVSDALEALKQPVKQANFDTSRRDDDDYRLAYVDHLWAEAVPAQVELNELARALTGENGIPGWRTKPKGHERILDKLIEYDNDASDLKDLAAAKIEFQTLDEIYSALARLTHMPQVTILNIKDRFRRPQGSGYRDVLLNLRMSNGHVAELRLHLAAVDRVAKWEHVLYEVRRDLDAIALAENRPLTPVEKAIRIGLLNRVQEAFGDAAHGNTRDGRID
ncbi:RelA/SpoT family protein [Micromonospora palomenae]|uniref:RelA/SpoT family protein n=1 Tax=Micromonospora palomenae TaxID=1461247 RepID=A0A561WCQ4_9ACTN|nr:toxin glutamine deamidase domain-containing protein [Micromonospora palomenae]TWG21648.1 RelA/SpoT family protein [Micromonospora palomenae]